MSTTKTKIKFNCSSCDSIMKKIDEIRLHNIKIDFLECPQCLSESEVTYDDNLNVKELYWRRL